MFIKALAKLVTQISVVLDGKVSTTGIELGEGVLELINSSRDIVKEEELQVLEALREVLEPKVQVHRAG